MKVRIVFTMTVSLMLWGLTTISYADLFVLIPDIQGESKDANHLGWSNALSSSWGHSQAPPGSTVKAQFSRLTITKELDSTAAALALFSADGRILPEVRLEFTTNVGDQKVVYLRIRLRNARLASYEVSGAADGPGTEMLGMTFAQISWAAFRLDAAGRLSPGSAACWDLINNTSKCQP